MTDIPYNRSLHTLALLTAAATFPLIFMGGLVTSHGAGMSVPDWPNTYGYNMFTFPPSHRVGGIFYEDRKSRRLNSSHLVIAYAVFRSKQKLAAQCKATVPDNDD